ncbi:MAG: hypothetical protein VKJ64_18855, partial [Leptolyngbyaceae bacterium]|nr:hypothetical protein [Leptolyngbyaceae bacterium]
HPNPSPRAGEGLSTQEPGLKSLLPFWEKGFREEGQSFVSQSGDPSASPIISVNIGAEQRPHHSLQPEPEI